MPGFEILSLTTRAGIDVEEVEFPVDAAPPGSGYMVGRQRDHGEPAAPQPVVIALHDERGDKATLLPDLEHLAAHGFLCLSIDSPVTRRASAARDPLVAFESQYRLAAAALRLLTDEQRDHPRPVALLGRGLGGEVAANVAARAGTVHAVVAIGSLPDRSEFVEHSPHPLAAGLRLFHDQDALAGQVSGLRTRRLVGQFESAPDTNWMLQLADDDDRVSDRDRAQLSLVVPRSVRVDSVAHARDFSSVQARRRRLGFITRLCG